MSNNARQKGNISIFIIVFLVILGIVFLAKQYFSVNQLSSSENINLVYLCILLSLIGSRLILNERMRNLSALKNASIWLIVLFSLIVLYSYRYEFDSVKKRFLGELLPSHGQENTDKSVSFKIAQDGHFHIIAEVNDVPVEFLLDTGASDVVITPEIARKIGINTDNLTYNQIYNTANGTVKGAPVTIGLIAIEGIKIRNIQASVNSSDLDKPLLGMSFLQKLSGYEVNEGMLTLRK